MKYWYDPPHLINIYEDEKKMKKSYGEKMSKGMIKFLGAVQSAENAYDIKVLPQFHMHVLTGNLQGVYSISLDNKATRWRLLAHMMDENGKPAKAGNQETLFLKTIKAIQINEMSDHYE